MDKLIELLNGHRKEMNGDGKWYIDTDNYNMLTLNNLDKLSSELWAISKEYGFIKWLVDNDKIDEYKVFCDQKEYFILQVGNDNYNSENYLVDGLLMLLSISDTPIDDLISYLR